MSNARAVHDPLSGAATANSAKMNARPRNGNGKRLCSDRSTSCWNKGVQLTADLSPLVTDFSSLQVETYRQAGMECRFCVTPLSRVPIAKIMVSQTVSQFSALREPKLHTDARFEVLTAVLQRFLLWRRVAGLAIPNVWKYRSASSVKSNSRWNMVHYHNNNSQPKSQMNPTHILTLMFRKIGPNCNIILSLLQVSLTHIMRPAHFCHLQLITLTIYGEQCVAWRSSLRTANIKGFHGQLLIKWRPSYEFSRSITTACSDVSKERTATILN
jgi:hypothetical protein